VRVASGTGFRSISAGSAHTCAVAADGSAWCWGAGTSGELGQGALVDWSDTPVRVQGGHVFRSVSAGHRHSCGVTMDGTGYCWGDNRDAQLGDGTTEQRLVPTAVGGGLGWKEIRTGAEHSCGIAADGRAYCWGMNRNGELGSDGGIVRPLPSAVAWSGTFRSLSVSGHSCGLTTEGQLVCWGGYDPLRLGIPGHLASSLARPAVGMGGMTFTAVSAGRRTCAVTGAGVTYCFGATDI